jgi:hypothetical protein
MKAQILKIAGVKNEKEFYKKFPTEETFMAKHGATLKKAQLGLSQPKTMPVNIAGLPTLQPQTIKSKYKKGFQLKDEAALENVGYDLLNNSGDIIGLTQDILQKKQDAQRSKLYANLSDKQKQAVDALNNNPASNIKRRYVRPEDQMLDLNQTINPYGVGTNYLAAEDGAMIGGNLTEIQNTYNPGDLYSDLGYQPLNDTSQLKQFDFGGFLKGATKGAGAIAPIGGGLGSLIGGGRFQTNSAGELGGDIGGAAGGIATAITGIPGLTEVGKLGGKLIGGWIGSDEAKQREKDQIKLENNAQQLAFNSFLKGNSAVMEDGGWVSHDWQPQVIATFGEHKVKDLLKPPHDADMLRAGGHLSYYTPPSAEAMYTGRAEDGAQLSMGGDLKTMWGGEAEPVSYNPYLPGTGETVMFKGQSHDETNSDGQSGIGVKYGDGGMTDYAEYGGSEQDADVEVERNEPGTELVDPQTGEKNLVVYGNMIIPDYGVENLNDKNAKGKKFKNYVADLNKIEAKQGKIIDKSSSRIDDIDGDSPFDQLSMNANHANIMGADMKLKDIAEKKKTAATVQNAILDTAKEYGLVSDELAKGKIKTDKDNNMYAKFGAKLETAADGKNLTNVQPALSGLLNLLYRKGYDVGNVSGKRSGKTAQGKQSRHNIGEALDVAFNKLGSKAYDTLTKDPDVVNYLVENGLTAINEYDPKVRAKTKGTAGHIHFGYDKGTPIADKFRKKFDPNTQIPGNNFGDNWSNERQIWQPNNMFPTNVTQYDNSPAVDSWTDDGSAYWKPILGVPQEFSDGYGWDKSNPMEKLWGPGTGIPTSFPNPKTRTGLLGKDYDPGYNEQPFWKPRNLQYTPSGPLTETRTVKSGSPVATPPVGKGVAKGTGKGKTVAPVTPPAVANKYTAATPLQAQGTPTGYNSWNNELMNIQASQPQASLSPMDPRKAGWDGSDNYQQMATQETPQGATQSGDGKFWDNSARFINSIAPYLRPSNQLNLDPRQLQGEMLALQDQVDPVQAQLYSPMLQAQPYSISLQDQLNEVTAATRAAERMSAYNPEAASMIAAQAYGAKNKILGEQFRMNQGEKARAFEANRAQLNDAQQKNLAILDQQYTRQELAKSNTEQKRELALNSIASKIQQNQLENRKVGIGENLYNYRFGPSGQAINLNPLAQVNLPNVGYGAYSSDQIGQGTTPKQLRAMADYQEEIDKKATKASKTALSKNGSIVKAIKNL